MLKNIIFIQGQNTSILTGEKTGKW